MIPVLLYYADVSPLENQDSFVRLFARMPAERQAKIEQLRFSADRRLSLGAGFLLACAQKENPGWHTNLSHSGTIAICAAAPCAVGCDVQILRTVSPGLAERFFSRSETEWLSSSPKEEQDRAIIRLWALKESYIKALGKGLAQPLDSFSVDVLNSVLGNGPVPATFSEAEIAKDYACTVCLLAEDFPEVQIVNLEL